MDKRQQQLGMNHSTAQQRLVKDTLFRLAVASGYKCHQCDGELVRETFSVEHKTPWLNASNAKELFFDQNNIAFSHHHCNVMAARRPHKKYFSVEDKRIAVCGYNQKSRAKLGRVYSAEDRRAHYLRTGK